MVRGEPFVEFLENTNYPEKKRRKTIVETALFLSRHNFINKLKPPDMLFKGRNEYMVFNELIKST